MPQVFAGEAFPGIPPMRSKKLAPETPAFRPGSVPTALKGGVSNWSYF